eukprot:gene2676-12778_t
MISRNMFSSCTTDEWRGPSGLNKQDIDAKQGALFSCQGAFTSPDQSLLNKSLHSTLAGTMISRSMFSSCTTRKYTPPATWPKEPELKTDASYYRHGPLRVPNNGANPYPAELGGPHFDPSGGKYSDAYFEQLKNDCPDPSDAYFDQLKYECPELDAEAAATTIEPLVFCPNGSPLPPLIWRTASSHLWTDPAPARSGDAFLVMFHLHVIDFVRNECKATVMFHFHVLDVLRNECKVMFHFHVLDFVRNKWKATVMFHFHVLDFVRDECKATVMFHFHVLDFVRNEWKATVNKIYRGFDWKLSRHLHSDPELSKVDLSNTKDQVEFKRITAGLKQLAIMSNRTLVFSDMPCSTEVKRVTAGLKQLAIMSNRTLAFPDMPCRTAWVHRDPEGVNACTYHTLLLQMKGETMPYAGLRGTAWVHRDPDGVNACTDNKLLLQMQQEMMPTAWVHRDPDGVNACTDNKLLLQMQKEMMPYAGRLAPWDKEDLRKEYRIFSAFVADKGCLGPTKYASGMMGVEFEEW